MSKRGDNKLGRNNIYRYYVEGEGDREIVNVLKSELECIQPGKVEVFNVNQERFTNMRLRGIKNNTTVILVYDTDTGEKGEPNLKKNIDILESRANVKKVICIPQVENLEDELVRACNIKEVKDLTKSRSNTNYKKDILKISNLVNRLKQCKFDFAKFWKKIPNNVFKKHGNDSDKIRLK